MQEALFASDTETQLKRRDVSLLSVDEILAEHPSAMDLFDSWCAARMNTEAGRPLSQESAVKYKAIWIQWLRYLCGDRTVWPEAKPFNVLGFIRSVNNRSDKTKPASDVSKKRYSTVLNDIYGFAKLNKHVEENPVPMNDKEIPANEAMASFHLNSTYRAAMLKLLPGNDDLASRRDRAMLTMMLLQGLSCSEIIGLHVASIDFGPDVVLPPTPAGEWLDVPQPRLVRITRERPERTEQERTLTLDRTTAVALQGWLKLRGLSPTARSSTRLFLSRRGTGELTPRAVFYVASEWVTQSMKSLGFEDACHAGPNALRNSCLVNWMEAEVEFEEIRRRAGLKRLDSIGRLVASADPRVGERYRLYLQEMRAAELKERAEREAELELTS